MHVGVIVEHSDPRRGGAERYAADLVARLELHGHRATVVARTGPAARPVRVWPAWNRPGAYAREFLPWLRAQGAERVLTLAPVPGCDFYQPRHGLVSRAMAAHYESMPEPMRTLRRLNPLRRRHVARLERWEARAVEPPTRFLASSPLLAREFAARYPGLREPPVLRTGVDLSRFSPGPPRARGEPRLLFAAHSFRLKGLETALRALARLPGARLVVVGRGNRAPFARLAGRLSVADRVEWRRDEPDLPRAYREADALVHPTFHDTAARVVLEALACGTPAVTTARDGNCDLAREGGGGAVEDPRDAAAVADALRAVLDRDPADRAARARAAAERHPADMWLDRVVEAITCGSTS